MAKVKCSKYAELLVKTFEKYRHVSVIASKVDDKESRGKGNVELPIKDDPGKTDKKARNQSRKEQQERNLQKSVNGEKLKQYKTRKSGERRPFLPEEDEILLKVLRKAPDGGKLKYKTISRLVKKLNRNDNSIVGRLDQLRSGRHLKMRKCFTLEEDLMIIDEALKIMKFTRSLEKTVLSNSKELGKQFNRNHWSIDLRWNTQIKTWLMQYYNKTLNLEIRPMLANFLADHFVSYKQIDWKFVLTYSEFKGHTEESLRLIFYTKMLFYATRNLKLKRNEITLTQIAEDTARMCLLKRRNRVIEERQKNIVDYFEKQISVMDIDLVTCIYKD